MKKEIFPILEYDPVSPPVVKAKKYLPSFAEAKCTRCLVTYFSDVVERYERAFKLNQAFKIRTEGVRPRVFIMKTEPNGEFIYVVPMAIGAPEAARVIESLSACGVKKFMVCGGAGTLDESQTHDNILIPVSAVRDEGTSYHYLPASREVAINPKVYNAIKKVLVREKVNHMDIKTWTTDAIFRETADKIELRKSEGCLTVEMECSAYYAVAQHKNLLCGQLLYAGDIVKPDSWNYREWHSANNEREMLFELGVKCLMEI